MCGEKSTDFVNQLADVRITPACAGKSNFNTICCMFNQDHPRMCGEKEQSLRMRFRCQGSPPHVRGKD